jgi:8-oxo-dGTP pyrophosphatase MutT (NUDIX family)
LRLPDVLAPLCYLDAMPVTNPDWEERRATVPKHILSAAIVVEDDDGQVLLVRGARRGWEMPGGQMEEGESPWEAAAREAQEESGVAVEVTAFCGLSYTAEHSVCNLLFRGRSRGGTATAQPAETLDAAFFPRGEALALVNYRNFRERIEMSLDPSSHGFFLIA